MTRHECLNDETVSGFVIRICFVIRHSDFVICHIRHLSFVIQNKLAWMRGWRSIAEFCLSTLWSSSESAYTWAVVSAISPTSLSAAGKSPGGPFSLRSLPPKPALEHFSGHRAKLLR